MSQHAVAVLLGTPDHQPLVESVRRLVSAVGVGIDWQPVPVRPFSEAGWTDAEWEEIVRTLNRTGLALCGPLGLPENQKVRSPHVELRMRAGCFAGLRPVRTLRGLPGRIEHLDVVIVRETTEDVYAGHEHEVMPGGVVTLKVVTEDACDRISHFAFSWARRHGRKKVSVIHKANIMKLTDGLFMNTAERVAKAYPEIQAEYLIVDNACMQLVLRPERFDVVVCGNMYGDILSAVAGGLVGAPPTMPGVAIAKRAVIFESVRTRPRRPFDPRAASPLVLLLPTLHLLRYLGFEAAADRLLAAAETVLEAGQIRTPDLGGTSSTAEMTDAVLAALEARP